MNIEYIPILNLIIIKKLVIDARCIVLKIPSYQRNQIKKCDRNILIRLQSQSTVFLLLVLRCTKKETIISVHQITV